MEIWKKIKSTPQIGISIEDSRRFKGNYQGGKISSTYQKGGYEKMTYSPS